MTATNSAAVPLFEAKGVAKYYGHVEALRGVDFEECPHEVVGLLGDNGAGKSTLIKILSGVVEPSEGVFRCNGREITIRSREDSEEIAGIQTIYQDIALVKSMSILRNIFAGREEKGLPGLLKMKSMRAAAMTILNEHVKIAGITLPDLLVEELSGRQA